MGVRPDSGRSLGNACQEAETQRLARACTPCIDNASQAIFRVMMIDPAVGEIRSVVDAHVRYQCPADKAAGEP